MIPTFAINRATTRGHAALFYDSAAERLELLARYFQDGVEANELCVFVTGESPKQAIDNLKSAGFEANDAVSDGSLRIFGMNKTYLPDGKFAADYMLQNVKRFQDEAKELGFKGLRTAGEMTWLYEHPESMAEAVQYEAGVNTLSSPSFLGLCLYPVKENFAKMIEGVTHAHPAFIYNSEAHVNPHFSIAS